MTSTEGQIESESSFLQISDVGNGQSDKKQGMTKKVGSEYLF